MLAYIELFQGRLHDFIEEGMKRGGKYLPMIQSVFRAEGLPLDLAYVPLVESAFKPNALSRAKAKGVWQFMAGTGVGKRAPPRLVHRRAIGSRKGHGGRGQVPSDAREDVRRRLASGAGVLQRRPGPDAAGRSSAAGVDDFWKLSAKAEAAAARDPRIRADDSRGDRHRQKPGAVRLRLRAGAAHRVYEKVTLSRPVDLRRIAEWAETTIDEIQALNPELRRWTTPVRDAQYELKVPAGTAERCRHDWPTRLPLELASLNWYTAKRGDTLALIAKKLNVSRNDLAEANYLKTTARVSTGQKLMVPREATVLMAARPTPAEPAVNAEKTPAVVTAARQTVPETGALANGAEAESRQGDLRGEAGRHARLNRPAVQDDGRGASRTGIRGFPGIASRPASA